MISKVYVEPSLVDGLTVSKLSIGHTCMSRGNDTAF